MGSYLSKTPKTETKITGRVAIVTGANRGVGYGTAKRLYELGATVYLGCRTESKASEAIERIRTEAPKSDGQLKWFNADMSSVKTAKQSAQAFLAQESQLDILIHNAAIGDIDYDSNEDGIDTNIAINYIGPFVFTSIVLDTMKQTSSRPGSDVRIVIISSMAHTMIGDHPVQFADEAELTTPFPSNTADINTWSSRMARYGRSKLADVVFAGELQRRLDAEEHNIIVTSLHPGLVKTDGALRSLSGIPYIGAMANVLYNLWFVDLNQGAATTIFAAVDPVVRAEPDQYKGKYLTPVGKVTTPSKLAQDPELAKRLWDLSEKIMESRGAA